MKKMMKKVFNSIIDVFINAVVRVIEAIEAALLRWIIYCLGEAVINEKSTNREKFRHYMGYFIFLFSMIGSGTVLGYLIVKIVK